MFSFSSLKHDLFLMVPLGSTVSFKASICLHSRWLRACVDRVCGAEFFVDCPLTAVLDVFSWRFSLTHILVDYTWRLSLTPSLGRFPWRLSWTHILVDCTWRLYLTAFLDGYPCRLSVQGRRVPSTDVFCWMSIKNRVRYDTDQPKTYHRIDMYDFDARMPCTALLCTGRCLSLRYVPHIFMTRRVRCCFLFLRLASIHMIYIDYRNRMFCRRVFCMSI